MDLDDTMTDGGVTLLSQTEEIALLIKTFSAHHGEGLPLTHTSPDFERVASQDAKVKP